MNRQIHAPKSALWWFFRISGINALARTANRSGLLVLTYHGILKEIEDPYLDRNSVDVANFDRQMRYLRDRFNPISASQLIRHSEDAIPFQDRSVLVTFDDGFENNLTRGFPVLVRHGVPAIIFVTTGMVGEPDAMLWTEQVAAAVVISDQSAVALDFGNGEFQVDLEAGRGRIAASRNIVARLKRLPLEVRNRAIEDLRDQLGVDLGEVTRARPDRFAFLQWDQVKNTDSDLLEIGSHTVSHQIMSGLDDDESFQELAQSKQAIETALGGACRTFSFPNGTTADFTERDTRFLREIGYDCAFTQIRGYNSLQVDRYEIRRLNIGSWSHDFNQFEAALSGILPMLKTLAGR